MRMKLQELRLIYEAHKAKFRRLLEFICVTCWKRAQLSAIFKMCTVSTSSGNFSLKAKNSKLPRTEESGKFAEREEEEAGQDPIAFIIVERIH